MHKKTLFLLSVLFLSCTKLKNDHLKTKTKELWLTTSFYSGPFFDDNQYLLASERAFFNLDALDINNNQIKTPKENNIIKAGSIAQILDITYPDLKTIFKRPLYSPRKNVWVYVNFGLERGKINLFYPKIHVIILPINIQTKDQVNEYIKKYFSLEDPNGYILTQRNHIKTAIWQKKPVIGMDRKQLKHALGEPISIEKTLNLDEEIHRYDYYIVFLRDGLVDKIQKTTIT